MHPRIYIVWLLLAFCLKGTTQPLPERGANGKWGMSNNGQPFLQPVYDTIFPFDAAGKICIACFKKKTASANKFIKVMTTSYSCRYIKADGKPLVIRTEDNDTCSVFGLTKSSVSEQAGKRDFQVSVNNKRYLVDRNMKQLTFKGAHQVRASADRHFYIVQQVNEADVTVTGLMDEFENELIPFRYSDIQVYAADSLIIACSAGIRRNAEDDLFDLTGKKVFSHHRHIVAANRHFIIEKMYEPQEQYIVLNREKHEEKPLVADELQMLKDHSVRIRIGKDWYIYDLNTGEKIPAKNDQE